jgi:23S rRNA pseudouridine2605 synthase
MAGTNQVRVHVYLAQRGFGSRRAIETMIREGKVSVNGRPATLGQKISPADDQLKVRGKLIPKGLSESETVVIALYKPRGVVTTAKDPEGRPTVLDFVPKSPRVYPVGRLDVNSEGLLLLTNDGDLAYRLTHPQFEVAKVYEVKIRGELNQRKLEKLKRGSRIGEERFQPADILDVRGATRTGVEKNIVKIRVHEGKNRHVRRLFEAVGCRVIRLKRISMGSVLLKGLGRAQYRYLSTKQISELKKETRKLKDAA